MQSRHPAKLQKEFALEVEFALEIEFEYLRLAFE